MEDLTAEETHSIREGLATQLKDKKTEFRAYNIESIVKFGTLVGSVVAGVYGENMGLPEPLRYALYVGAMAYTYLTDNNFKALGKYNKWLPKSYQPDRFKNSIHSAEEKVKAADKLLFMKMEGQEFTRHHVKSIKYGGNTKNYLTSDQLAQIDLTVPNTPMITTLRFERILYVPSPKAV